MLSLLCFKIKVLLGALLLLTPNPRLFTFYQKRINLIVFDFKHFHMLVKIVVTHYFVSLLHPRHSNTQLTVLVGKIHQKV